MSSYSGERAERNRLKAEGNQQQRLYRLNLQRKAMTDTIAKLRDAGVNVRDLPQASQIANLSPSALADLDRTIKKRAPQDPNAPAPGSAVKKAPDTAPARQNLPSAIPAGPAPGVKRMLGDERNLQDFIGGDSTRVPGVNAGAKSPYGLPEAPARVDPTPGETPLVSAARRVPFANGMSGEDMELQQTGSGLQAKVNSESGPRWVAVTPNLMQTMSAKTGGAWDGWSPEQRRNYLKGAPDAPAQGPAGFHTAYGDVSPTKAAGEAHGPSVVRTDDGQYRDLPATTAAMATANESNTKRGAAQNNNADVAAQAVRLAQDPTSRAIAAEVNKNLGTNITPQQFQADLTVPVPAAGVEKLPRGYPTAEAAQAGIAGGGQPAPAAAPVAGRVPGKSPLVEFKTPGGAPAAPLANFQAPSAATLTPLGAPATTPVASLQPGTVDGRPDPYNERRTRPLPGTVPFGTNRARATADLLDKFDFTGHGGHVAGTPLPATGAGMAAKAMGVDPQAAPDPTDMADSRRRPLFSFDSPAGAPASPGPVSMPMYTGNVQTGMDEGAPIVRKPSTAAFAGF